MFLTLTRPLTIAAAIAFGTGAMVPLAVQAATLDFTDQVFTVVTPSGQAGNIANSQPNSMSETADGVVVTFDALTNIAGDLRFTGLFPGEINGAAIAGLRVGGANSSLLSFSLTASEAISLTGYSISTSVPNNIEALSTNPLVQELLTLSIFEGIGTGGTELSSGNSLFSGANVTLSGVSIAAGQTVTFAVQGGGTGGGLSIANAALSSLSFDRTTVTPPPPPPPGPSPVPLPASALLLAAAVAGLGALRRRLRGA